MSMKKNINYWAIPSFAVEEGRLIKTDNIISDVCRVYDITIIQLMGKSRLRILVEPRQVVFYILHKKLNLTLTEIGKMFDKHHATVLHGANLMKNYMIYDEELRKRIIGVIVRNDYNAIDRNINTSTDTLYSKSKKLEKLINK